MDLEQIDFFYQDNRRLIKNAEKLEHEIERNDPLSYETEQR